MRIESYTFTELADKKEGMEKLAKAIENTRMSYAEKIVDIEKEWSENKNLADYKNRLDFHTMINQKGYQMISQPIITNPSNGWCTFTLGEFIGTPSYINDVPGTLLDAIIAYLKNDIGAVIFDEEGKEFTFVIEEFESFIIAEHEDTQHIHIQEDADDIINNILNCIKTDIDAWSMFCVIENNETAFQKAKQHNKACLIQKLKTIQQLKQNKGRLTQSCQNT